MKLEDQLKMKDDTIRGLQFQLREQTNLTLDLQIKAATFNKLPWYKRVWWCLWVDV